MSSIMKGQKDSDKFWQLYYKRNGWENQRCLNWKGETLRKTRTLAFDVRRFAMKDRHFLCDSRGQCWYQRVELYRAVVFT